MGIKKGALRPFFSGADADVSDGLVPDLSGSRTRGNNRVAHVKLGEVILKQCR